MKIHERIEPLFKEGKNRTIDGERRDGGNRKRRRQDYAGKSIPSKLWFAILAVSMIVGASFYFDWNSMSEPKDKSPSVSFQTAEATMAVPIAPIDFHFRIVSERPLTIIGSTNLPDGSKVAFHILGRAPPGGIAPCSPLCAFLSYPTVVDGKFSSGSISVDGNALSPDTYSVGVFVLPSSQPAEIAKIMGKYGQQLRGPYATTQSSGGTYLKFSQIITVRPDGSSVLGPIEP